MQTTSRSHTKSWKAYNGFKCLDCCCSVSYKSRHTDWLTASRNMTSTLTFATSQDSCDGRLEHLRLSPASHKRQQKGNPVPGHITGPPCPWDLALQIGAVSNETVNCAGLGQEKQVTDPSSRQRVYPTSRNQTESRSSLELQMEPWPTGRLADSLSVATELQLHLQPEASQSIKSVSQSVGQGPGRRYWTELWRVVIALQVDVTSESEVWRLSALQVIE
jgi:hypothetical protein